MIEPTKKVFSLLDEFKQFALKGNVIDLAVGVIIGAAFGKIVDSLVKNVIMPLIGAITPQLSYQDWAITLGENKVRIGELLGDIVNFIFVALALWIFIVKFLGWVMRKRKEEVVVPPPPTREEELLMEIRDLLRTNRGQGS